MKRRCLAVALGITVCVVAPAGAETAASDLAIRDRSATVRWAGEFADSSAVASTPEACVAVDCDELMIDLALPPHKWNPGGGLQVGIRWEDEDQDLDLFVYRPDGRLAARSDGVLASMAESVLVPAPTNGRYRVVVVPRYAERLQYQGMAQIEQGIRPQPTRDLLPDLVALPSRNATFDTGAYYLSEPATSIGGCYPEERVERGALRCLRFDQILANTGTGPFELRYDVSGAATDQRLLQRVMRSDGSVWERDAGMYEFHPVHAHFHYRNFAVSRLWLADIDGRRIGDAPVRVGHKNGFCVIDVDNVWFSRHGDAARSYYFPQCLAPATSGGSSPVLRQGMSVGWADVYNWFLADQYIEVSGVPDGDYLLETIADPDGLVLEADEDNNRSFTHIRICGDRSEIVGSQGACT